MLRTSRPWSRGALLAALTLAALGAFSTSSARASLLIDDFGEAPFSLKLMSGQTSAVNTQTGLATVLGGSRVTTLQRGNLGTYKGPVRPEVATGVNEDDTNVLVLASPSDFAGKMTLQYGLHDNTTFNFTPGNDAFHIDVVSYDAPGAAPMSVTVIVTSGLNVTESASMSIPETLVPTSYKMSFDNFTFATLSSANTISFVFNTPAGGDLEISALSTGLPEPAVAGLLAPATLLISRRRR